MMNKLKSRKLWAAVVGVIVGLAAAFGIDSGEYTEIAGIVTSAVSVMAYIFGESAVDADDLCGIRELRELMMRRAFL